MSGNIDFAPRQLLPQKIQRPLTRWLPCTNMSVGFAGVTVKPLAERQTIWDRLCQRANIMLTLILLQTSVAL